MKLFILGHGRHGKDTVGDILADRLKLRVISSSWFLMEKAVKPYLIEQGITFSSDQEMFDRRGEYRSEWKEAIRQYNTPCKSRLSRELFAEGDIYVGLRDREEYEASRHLADLSIWVDASKRKGVEVTNDLTARDADVVIDNNGTEEELRKKMLRFTRVLRYF